MKKYRLFFAVLWTVSLIAIVSGQIISNKAKADDEVKEAVNESTESLSSYYNKNHYFPDNLSALEKDIDKNKVEYNKISNSSYEICVNYSSEEKSYDDKKLSNEIEIEYSYVPEGHPKGRVCYKETKKDYDNDYNIPSGAGSSSSKVGADCGTSKSTVFTSSPVKITAINDVQGTVFIGNETYKLCKTVEVRNGTKYLGGSTYNLYTGQTVVMSGKDKNQIDKVVIQ